ncbi:MAG: hypothetical protein ACI9ON_001846 [Limisphaerales bacterium]|jgi:hypothetical protein
MKILYLTASPPVVVMDEADETGNDEQEYPKLDLWPELKEVTNVLFEARSEGYVALEMVPEVRREDLTRYLSRRKVNVLHFSGHGNQTGESDDAGNKDANLIWQGDYGAGEFVPNAWLKEQIEQHNIDIVVLNCCWSEQVAESLQGSVSLAIGTTGPLRSDQAADFSRVLYDSLQQGLSLREVEAAVKKKVGDKLYAFKKRDDTVGDHVLPPEPVEKESPAKKIESPAKEVLSVQQRLERVRGQLPTTLRLDIIAMLAALAFSFLGYWALDSYGCADKEGACQSSAGTCATSCESATCPLCDKKTCGIDAVCGDKNPFATFNAYLSEMLAESEWLKFEPFAILTALASGPASRFAAGLWIFWITLVGRNVLPVVGAQTRERLAQDLEQGRIGKASEWLAEFEK